MSSYNYNDDDIDARGFFEKYRLPIFIGVVVVLITAIGIPVYILFSKGKMPPPRKPQEIVVHLVMPPPPPPPPPPPVHPPPPIKQKMIVQTPVKPHEAPPHPTNVAHTPSSPGAHGPASANGTLPPGTGDGNDIGSDDGGGSQFGWYAAQVIDSIQSALKENAGTRDARFQVKVRIWSDSTGRITRAELSGSTGDPSIDSALKNEVLIGLKLQQPPPQDMPMPIVLRITAQRPT